MENQIEQRGPTEEEITDLVRTLDRDLLFLSEEKFKSFLNDREFSAKMKIYWKRMREENMGRALCGEGQENHLNVGDRYIRLYHGTASHYQEAILENGLQPRRKTKNSNFENNKSQRDYVYLTNKWHYWYAYTAALTYLKNNYKPEYVFTDPWGKQRGIELIQQSILHDGVFPIYFEFEVPIDILAADEDSYATDLYKIKVLKSQLKKDNTFMFPSISWRESLAYNGTVAIGGVISPEMIRSVTLLKDPGLVQKLMGVHAKYQLESVLWDARKKPGNMTLQQLEKIESAFSGVVKLTY